MPVPRCIIILSEKSSGSSALQRLLVDHCGAKCVTRTRHFENETLYWVKAAAVLDRPQTPMVNSEVPFLPERARADLRTLLGENVPDFDLPRDDEKMIFEGWRALCAAFSPVFIEKSPHHICQYEALSLLETEIIEGHGIEYRVVGLIRNPMDVIYSQFLRWGSSPWRLEKQWLQAYRNLQGLKQKLGDRMTIVRYEDLADSDSAASDVVSFCAPCIPTSAPVEPFHQRSVRKWDRDGWYGYRLTEETRSVAKEYGYAIGDLENTGFPLWQIALEGRRARHRLRHIVRRGVYGTRRRIKGYVHS